MQEQRSPFLSSIVYATLIASGVGVPVSMSWKMFLEIARKPNSSRVDEERRGVTIGRQAYIADIMLFDRSSLAEASRGTHPIFLELAPERGLETYRILLS